MSLFICLFIFPAAASLVLAESFRPFQYRCGDGRIFTITFLKETGEDFPSKARLAFPEDKKTEILVNQLTGSGIRYANEKYEYREHQGDVWLTDFTRPGEGDHVYKTPCRQVK
jgi:membrane-bound inhibitor of C-type lysozyme